MMGSEPNECRSSIYYHYYKHGFYGVPRHEGVSNGQYKLINYYTLGEWELFDLKNDPNEMFSVYDSLEYKEIRERMKLELSKKREQYNLPPNEQPPYY